jgi:integrase
MGRHRKSYTDEYIASIPAPKSGKRKQFPDSDQRGLYIRITPTGTRSFVAVKQVAGKQTWSTLNATGIEQARELARGEIARIKHGLPKPVVVKPDTFRDVADNWFKRVVQAKGHRSEKHVRGCLDNHILPAWGERPLDGIGRADIAKLLDHIEEKAGSSAADKTLNVISRICAWHQSRDDKYRTPVVRGMRRISTKEQSRERILSDDEIRTIWTSAEANGQFGALVRLLLLTGQRQGKVRAMKWSEIEDGVWTPATELREKGNIGAVKLPQAALDILANIARVDGNPYVFAGQKHGSRMGSLSITKAAFDKKNGICGWRLHDLRRTARSLLSRTGVSSDHAERILGHAIRGVEGTYDRHRYEQEKAEALRKLAGLIALIVTPPADNVVPLAG